MNMTQQPKIENLHPITTLIVLLCLVPSYSSIRLLEQSSDQPTAATSNSSSQMLSFDKSTFLLVLIVGSALFVGVALICCIVCTVRCIIRVQRNSARGRGKICNLDLELGGIWSGVEFWMFRKYVGVPYQPNCIICLEQFKAKTPKMPQHPAPSSKTIQSGLNLSNPSPHPSPQPSQKLRILHAHPHPDTEQSQIPQIELMPAAAVASEIDLVKMTLCGHLFHENCLDSWYMKEHICPLCRQSFQIQDIQMWGVRLGVDLLQFGERLQMIKMGESRLPKTLLHLHQTPVSKLQKHPFRPLNMQTTMNQIEHSRQSNRIQESPQLIFPIAQDNSLTLAQKQILALYRIIMRYHRKEPVEEENPVSEKDADGLKGERKANGRELYFQEDQEEYADGKGGGDLQRLEGVHVTKNVEPDLQETRDVREMGAGEEFRSDNVWMWEQEMMQRKKKRSSYRRKNKISSNKPSQSDYSMTVN